MYHQHATEALNLLLTSVHQPPIEVIDTRFHPQQALLTVETVDKFTAALHNLSGNVVFLQQYLNLAKSLSTWKLYIQCVIIRIHSCRGSGY
jgi:hypothetical protein